MLFYIIVLISFLYLLLILLFFIGWKRMSMFIPTGKLSQSYSISVVVVCKNEELHLPKLLSCLAQQSFQNFELVLVNDHSTDSTLMIMKSVQGVFENLQIVDATGFGKKAALKEGLESAKGRLLVTTDGDCIPDYHWLETISCFHNQYPSDLIICPVRLTNTKPFIDVLQLLEFTSLVAAGAGAAGIGMPILCNGANLAFTKRAWLKSKSDLRFDEQSGDDVFLLQSIKKRGGKIRFLKSESAFVTTKAASTFSEFFKQRQRWAGKAPAYTDWQLIFTACIVFSVSLLILVLLWLSLFDNYNWKVLLAVSIVKFIADTTFLYTVRNFFQLQYLWLYAFILSLIYPFYIVLVALGALFFKPKKWK